MANDDSRDFGSGLSDLGGSENPAEVTQRYDEWVDGYESDVRSWGYDVPEVLAAKLGPTVGRILDAGCGTGLCGHALATTSPDAHVTGVDASPESVDKAEATGLYASTAVVDLTEPLPFGDDEFDGLIGLVSQKNGLCMAASSRSLDLALSRMNWALVLLDEDDEKKKKDKDKDDTKKEEKLAYVKNKDNFGC